MVIRSLAGRWRTRWGRRWRMPLELLFPDGRYDRATMEPRGCHPGAVSGEPRSKSSASSASRRHMDVTPLHLSHFPPFHFPSPSDWIVNEREEQEGGPALFIQSGNAALISIPHFFKSSSSWANIILNFNWFHLTTLLLIYNNNHFM